MLNPFTFYSRIASAAFDMASTAVRASEMLGASQEVIAKRSSMIGVAGRYPLEGDYVELGKMVPEKIDAFSKAGAAMAGDWWVMQTAAITESQKLARMAMSGRIPTLAEWTALAEHNAAFGLKSFERVVAASAKGLRPIHAAATANAKRLRRGKT